MSEPLKWCLDRRLLHQFGCGGLRLGPTSARLFDSLWRAKDKRLLSIEQIADILYVDDPDGGPDDVRKNIHVLIHHLRKKLAPFGLVIKSTFGPGAGYYLVETEREVA